MRPEHRRPLRIVVYLTVLALVAGCGSGVVSRVGPFAITGAIWTSLSDGTTVNANIYDSKDDVYINGGPQTPRAAGLPDGTYYFQVTDPSGATLLSSDDATCRQVTVSGGRITGATGPCPHPSGTTNPSTGVTPVKLMPYDDTPNPGGEYKVWLIDAAKATIHPSDPKKLDFQPRDAKTDNFKVRRRDGQPPLVSITGYKWYDTNTNGQKDGDEVNIGGWRIEKSPPTPADVTYTSSIDGPGFGTYGFLVAPNSGTYTISEVAPPPGFFPAGVWVPTTPTSGAVTVGSTDAAGPNFGNVCLGPTGGRTIGFWTNRNGQALIDSGDLEALRDLNLRNADGSDFDPTTAEQLRTWLLNATATNMAYMLSAQLAAMTLNVREGFVSASAMLFVGVGFPGANPAGFISVGDLMGLANTSLGSDGSTPAGHPQRAYQEQLKNALDAANNNRNLLVQPGPASCPPIPENY